MREAREWGGLLRGRYSDAMRNTQTYLVMAHDDGAGVVSLEDDRARVHWHGVGDQPVFTRVDHLLEQASVPLGGTYERDPLWTKLFGNDVITVHPLGGCVMGEDAATGVVDHMGQVFSDARGDAVHDGLFVMDGSVVPRPLGVNPLLTISALAERSCSLIATARGWSLDYALPSRGPAPRGTGPASVIEFTETMRGYVSRGATGSFEDASKRGFDVARHGDPKEPADYREGSAFEFTLTIVSEDLDAMLSDPEHPAKMVGTVRARMLSADALTVTDGVFNLFTTDPARPGEKRMRYRMLMTDPDGHVYSFEGYKVIRDDPGVDLWADTTTLYVTIHDGAGSDGDPIAKGILRIRPRDFMRQLTTMQAVNAPNVMEGLRAKARFGAYFAGALYDTYGALLI